MNETTPGPWRFEEDRFRAGLVLGADGEIVADNVTSADGPVLAAPLEIFEALRGTLCHTCGYRIGEERQGPTCVACERARAAVAKASP